MTWLCTVQIVDCYTQIIHAAVADQSSTSASCTVTLAPSQAGRSFPEIKTMLKLASSKMQPKISKAMYKGSHWYKSGKMWL